MKGDGAAIPSSRFLRRPEQPLITLCSHASPPPPPRPPPFAVQPIRARAAGQAGQWRGQGRGDVRAARNVPSDSPASLIEVRAAPSVCPRQLGSPPPSAPAPRLPPPPAPPPALPFPASRPTPFPPLPASLPALPSSHSPSLLARLFSFFFLCIGVLRLLHIQELSVAAYIKGRAIMQ